MGAALTWRYALFVLGWSSIFDLPAAESVECALVLTRYDCLIDTSHSAIPRRWAIPTSRSSSEPRH